MLSGPLIIKDDGYAYIKVDSELTRYLRKLYFYATFGTSKLSPPSRGSHITVVSPHDGIKVPDIEQGRAMSYALLHKPSFNGNAWAFPIISEEISEFRLTLGLPRDKLVPLHLCIGYERSGKTKWT